LLAGTVVRYDERPERSPDGSIRMAASPAGVTAEADGGASVPVRT
jgi:hypothetical protein